MGLFSDRCPNPDCNARVKKGANYCSKCGYGGPNSLMPCPQCGKQAGRDSSFCWNCGADLKKDHVPRIFRDRWVRDEDEFAVRVDPQDCKGFLSRQITVDSVTVGLIEKHGRITKEVEWGARTLDGILAQAKSIFLISAGDAVFRPRFAGLRDANSTELDVTVQIILRVSDYEAFVRQFFQGHRRVTRTILEDAIVREVQDVTRAIIRGSTLEDMYGNLEWRNAFEQKLRDAMTVTLSRNGLDLVQLNFVDFGGDRLEELERERGDLYMGNLAADRLAERQAIARRVADLEAQGKLADFKGEKELADQIEDLNEQQQVKSVLRRAEREDAIRQAKHELELKTRLRQFEVEDLDTERKKQRETEGVLYEQELDKIRRQHESEIAMTGLIARNQYVATEEDFKREQARLSNEHTLRIEWDQSEQRRRGTRADAVQRYELLIQESSANLEAARNRTTQQITELEAERAKRDIAHVDKDRDQERELTRRRAEVDLIRQMQQMDREQLETMQRFKLEEKRLDLDYKRFEKEKDAEVQIAAVDGNVKIAQSQAVKDAAVSTAVADQLKERLTDQKEEKEALRRDADRRAGDIKETVTILTSKPQPAPTVVLASPGLGVHEVTTGGLRADESPCPSCGRPVPHIAKFCPWCKHEMSRE